MTPQRIIAQRALRGVENLTPADRADVYEGVAMVLVNVHREESAEAYRIATAIREAEASQLKFAALLQASMNNVTH